MWKDTTILFIITIILFIFIINIQKTVSSSAIITKQDAANKINKSSPFIVGLTYNIDKSTTTTTRTMLRQKKHILLKHPINNNKNNNNNNNIAAPPSGICKLDINTGNITLLEKFLDVVYVMETAYSPEDQIYYLLVNGFTLKRFYLTNNTFAKDDIIVDISDCDGGSSCFNEVHFDLKNKRLIATGVGYPNGLANSIVSIDIHTGKVKSLVEFSVECGVYLEVSNSKILILSIYIYIYIY